MEKAKKIKIGAFDYDLIPINAITVHGECSQQDLKITINTSDTYEQQQSSLIHEILEALNLLYSLDLEHDAIIRLENSLYQVLKDNEMLRTDHLLERK